MRIKIGPYKSDIIPIRSWERRYEYWRRPDTLYLPEEEYTWYDTIVFGFFDKLFDLVLPINRWGWANANSRKRKIQVHIHNYDVWGADHTLALIIHPVLVKLKECKQGSPNVDDEDVPDHLKSTSARPKEQDYDIDEFHHARWEYVLDEMIWAFEQHTHNDCNDDQFYHNSDQLDMTFEKIEGSKSSKININHQKDLSKPAYWIDEWGKHEHYERITNGRRLFAKYYCSLWD